jgi:hypothetical protein
VIELRSFADLPSTLLRQLHRRPSLLAPLFYTAVILALSSVPGIVPDDAPLPYQVIAWVPPQVQNLLHIPLYGGLSFIWCWYLVPRTRPNLALSLALLITIVTGVVDEWYQSFVPGRYGSLTDMVLNGVGAGLGVLAFRVLRWRLSRHRA